MLDPENSGFTLTELLVALLIASIVLSFSLPNFSRMIDRHQLKVEAQGLKQILQYARQSAITLGKVVNVCPTIEGLECGGSWQQGQLVMTNRQPLRVWRLAQNHLKLDLNRDKIRYLPDGSAEGFNGTFVYQPHDRENKPRLLSIARSGHVSLKVKH